MNRRIRIFSLNVFVRPPLVRETLRSDYKDERLADLWNHYLPQYDIIALQELFGNCSKRRSRFLDKAYSEGFGSIIHSSSPPCCFPRCPRWKAVDGGLTILSRFPSMDLGQMLFTAGSLSDGFAAKGVIYMKIRLPDDGPHIHFFTTHLQASYSDVGEADQLNCLNARNHQINELKDFIEEKMCTDNDIGIIAGDFNVDGNNDPDDYKNLLNRLSSSNIFTVQDALLEQNGRHEPTFAILNEKGQPLDTFLTEVPERGSQQALDYIFILHRSNSTIQPHFRLVPESAQVLPFKTSNRPYAQLSDHCGVTCEIEY